MIAGVPYDAQIAYLESTGTQYINTGVTGASEWHITAQGAATPTTSNCVIATTSSGGSFWGNYGALDYWAVGNGSSWRCSLPYTSLGSFVVTFSSSAVQFTVNGETVTRDSAPNFSKAFCLFSTNGDGYGATVRVYGCKVYQNGVLVRDYIPVRVGQVGYLYDRVTRKLYGNTGTGAFTLGPDVATPVMGLRTFKPTARNYVQSGLVAMWDGIENAGWGVHDANATVWKDLVGSTDITLSGVQIFADHIYFPKSGGYGLASFPDSFGCIEIVLAKDVSQSGGGISASVVQMGAVLYSGYGINAPQGKLTDTNDSASAPYVLISDGELFSASLNKSGATTSEIAKNGVIGASGTVAAGSRYAITRNCINVSTLNAQRSSDLWFRCMRLYSRALSSAEIAANYAVDKARFGIGGAS